MAVTVTSTNRGVGETMVPEGLEWASAEEILDDIASVGFNYIRMYGCWRDQARTC